jgi:hypothetical protein
VVIERDLGLPPLCKLIRRRGQRPERWPIQNRPELAPRPVAFPERAIV